MKEYVLGFAFDKAKEQVVLIEKQKPDWQKGKYNGVGGKIEPSDTSPYFAMAREFYEETGVDTKNEDWVRYATMNFGDDIMGGSAIVHVFSMFNNDMLQCSTCEEEVIGIIPMKDLYELPLMHNLHILIPLALQTEFYFTQLNQLPVKRT